MGAFSIFSGKETKKTNDCGMYYRRLSLIFTICKFAMVLGLIITILIGFSFHTDQINMDNFRYLMNSVGAEDAKDLSFKTLYYDSSDDNKFIMVRGDLAVVNSSGSTVYTLAGQRKSADATLRMDNPDVLASAKYMYIYDLGGTELIVKDTINTVETIRYDYPIRAAAATDIGKFAVVSREKTTRSTVFVYDDKYREVYKCSFRDLNTVSIDLSEDGESLICTSFTADEGEFLTQLAIYSLSGKEPVVTLSYRDEYPYKACFTENGGYMLLTSKGCRFYDVFNSCTATLTFGDEEMDSFYMDDSYFIQQSSVSAMTAEEILKVYNTAGKLLWQGSFEHGIKLAECAGDYLFTVSGTDLAVVRLSDGETAHAQTEEDMLDIMPIGEDNALLLTKGSANVLDYGGLFNKEMEESE